jgi:hypothetical protein
LIPFVFCSVSVQSFFLIVRIEANDLIVFDGNRFQQTGVTKIAIFLFPQMVAGQHGDDFVGGTGRGGGIAVGIVGGNVIAELGDLQEGGRFTVWKEIMENCCRN